MKTLLGHHRLNTDHESTGPIVCLHPSETGLHTPHRGWQRASQVLSEETLNIYGQS